MGSGLARINLAAPPHEHHEQDALPPADFPELAQLVGTRSAYVARCVRAGSQTITNDGEYDLLTAALACDPVDLDLVHAVLASRSTELQELDGHYDISSVNRDYIIRHSAVEAARRAIDGDRPDVLGALLDAGAVAMDSELIVDSPDPQIEYITLHAYMHAPRRLDLCDPVSNSTLTVRELGEQLHQGRWSRECEIQLACGVVMPQVTVDLRNHRLSLRISGSIVVECDLRWDNWEGHYGLTHLNMGSFFYHSPLPRAYRDALAKRTHQAGHPPISAPHVFMLLIDELVYWATKKHGMSPGCEMELLDAINLDYATGPTPFALCGRHVFSGTRNSRFLQNERGYGYYVTFGFWPVGAQHKDYMRRMSRLSGRLFTGPGDADYAETAQEVNRRQTRSMRKSLPPVLPPLAGGDPRVFADMDDYYRRVLVVGSYGQAAGVARPAREPGAPAELA